MRHDNIRHALIAIYANNGRYCLTSTDVRRIVAGVTGRAFNASTWTTGMRRAQVAVNLPRTMGNVIPGHAYPWRWRHVDVGAKLHGIVALTPFGQLEAKQRLFVDSVDLAPYDANAWVPMLRRIDDLTRPFWSLRGMDDGEYVSAQGDFVRRDMTDEYGALYDIGGWREATA